MVNTGKATEPLCKYPAGQFVPQINRKRCEGKADCVQVCPTNVFAVQTLPASQRSGLGLIGTVKGIAHRWQQAIVVNSSACEACGLCIKACPENAISLVKSSAAVSISLNAKMSDG